MTERKSSYGKVLKSSTIVGGAQVINLIVGMVRVKFVAILIGPAGVGLVGTYTAITSMVSSLSGLGLNSSGVREVAVANGSGDAEQVGRAALTLRRMVWLTGVIGALVLVVLAVPISLYTFKDRAHTLPLIYLASTVFFAAIQGGQMALIQGMRKIADLAKINVLGTVVGSLFSVGLYYLYGIDGIVPSLIVLAALNLVFSWWFARKIPLPFVNLTWKESFAQTGGLVKLGFALMWSCLLVSVVGYLTRTLISRNLGIDDVGIFQAAFNLSGVFVSFVFGSMGADFYPSLTLVAEDNEKVNCLVNEQTEIGMFLAVPGLIATIVFAPWVIHIFYSSAFEQSIELLRWFAFGCLGKVISWPMGFILLAKGESRLFFITESLFNILHLVLIWVGMTYLGITGVAVAFVVMYLLYALGMLLVSRKLTSFTWSEGVKNIFAVFIPISLVVFISSFFVPQDIFIYCGIVICVLSTLYCLKQITYRLGPEHRICMFINRFIS